MWYQIDKKWLQGLEAGLKIAGCSEHWSCIDYQHPSHSVNQYIEYYMKQVMLRSEISIDPLQLPSSYLNHLEENLEEKVKIWLLQLPFQGRLWLCPHCNTNDSHHYSVISELLRAQDYMQHENVCTVCETEWEIRAYSEPVENDDLFMCDVDIYVKRKIGRFNELGQRERNPDAFEERFAPYLSNRLAE